MTSNRTDQPKTQPKKCTSNSRDMLAQYTGKNNKGEKIPTINVTMKKANA